MNCNELNAGRLQHLAVVHRLLHVVKDPDLAGDGNVVLVVGGLDHLAQKFPFILKKRTKMSATSDDLEYEKLEYSYRDNLFKKRSIPTVCLTHTKD